MEYRLEKLAAFTAIGLVTRSSSKNGNEYREIPAFWRECDRAGHLGALRSRTGPLGLLGICLPYEEDGQSFEYMIGIEAPADKNGLPADCREISLPRATYGVFESRGPMPETVQGLWKRLFSEWFLASGHEHAGSPDFEAYPGFPPGDPRGDPRSPEHYCEIWVPLRKKG